MLGRRPFAFLQNSSSAFGAFLDPVADKLMVATAMILLSTSPLPLGPMAGNNWIVPLLTCGEKKGCLCANLGTPVCVAQEM